MSVLSRIAQESNNHLKRGSWTPPGNAYSSARTVVKFNKVEVRVLDALLTFTEWDVNVSVNLHYGENMDVKLKIRKEDFNMSWGAWNVWATQIVQAMDTIPEAHNDNVLDHIEEEEQDLNPHSLGYMEEEEQDLYNWLPDPSNGSYVGRHPLGPLDECVPWVSC
jgi:hypothetical protein